MLLPLLCTLTQLLSLIISSQVGVENRKRPTTIALSRQNMPNLPGTSKEGVALGGYTIKDCQVIILLEVVYAMPDWCIVFFAVV